MTSFLETSSHNACSRVVEHNNQPPPYTEVDETLPPSSSTNKILETSCVKNCDPKQVERLRRFISYSLARDYGLASQTLDRLSKNDWHFWVHFSESTLKLYAKECPESWFFFIDWPDEPAAALEINPRHILFRLLFFPYESPAEDIIKDYGLPILAAKLVLDRDELLDKVLPPNRNFRALMFSKHREIRNNFFLDLNTEYGLERCKLPDYKNKQKEAQRELKHDPAVHVEEEYRHAGYLADFSDLDLVLVNPALAHRSRHSAKRSVYVARLGRSSAMDLSRRFALLKSESEARKLGLWKRTTWENRVGVSKVYYMKGNAHWEEYKRGLLKHRTTYSVIRDYVELCLGTPVGEHGDLREGRSYFVWTKDDLQQCDGI